MENQVVDKKPLGEIYKASFFSRRYRLDWRAKHICKAVIAAFDLSPGQSLIDVGCAIGEYIKYFKEKHGIQAEGIEGSPEAREFFVTGGIMVLDLREHLRLFQRYDACISLEVAEHIEPEYADMYVDNLVTLSDNILVTAAPIGQGGHYHVNCQPQRYWETKFFAQEYFRDHQKERAFKDALSHISYRKEIRAYVNNCMVFRRLK